jgi:hypothetical protein
MRPCEVLTGPGRNPSILLAAQLRSGFAEPRRRSATRRKQVSGLTAIQAGASEHQGSHAHRHDGLGRLFPPLLGTVAAWPVLPP